MFIHQMVHRGHIPSDSAQSSFLYMSFIVRLYFNVDSAVCIRIAVSSLLQFLENESVPKNVSSAANKVLIHILAPE